MIKANLLEVNIEALQTKKQWIKIDKIKIKIKTTGNLRNLSSKFLTKLLQVTFENHPISTTVPVS